MSKTKEYSNGEVTVVWEAEKCIHSAICAKGLPKVFQPKDRPEGDKTSESMETKIEVVENGPLLVYGTLKVTHKDGKQETKNRTTAFCRCGLSNNKPFCDGTHVKQNFVG